MSMRKYASIVDMKGHISNFKKALEVLQKEKERKEDKQKEKENYAKHKPDQALENERKDPGRD